MQTSKTSWTVTKTRAPRTLKSWATWQYRMWQRRRAYRRYMDSPEWQIVRAECMRRAKGKCEQCKRFAAREVHHNTYRADLFETAAADCVALCSDCHAKKHRKGKVTRA